jgi:carboxypeptidase C (cathepsin A)
MLKFSGNTDGAVPTTGTRNWIDSMNRPIHEEQRTWFIPGQNTAAGVITEYEGLTFATVHGAGHMAPQFKPPQTYHLIFNWINHKPI